MQAKHKDLKLTEYIIKGWRYCAAEHPLFNGYWPTTCGNVLSTNSSYNGQGGILPWKQLLTESRRSSVSTSV